MSATLSHADLLAALKSHASALGLVTRDEGQDGFTGEAESIRAKWFLGGRKVSYRVSCRLADVERHARFREAFSEKTWGLPPPTFSVEKTMVKGWERSGQRNDRSLGGGGSIDYARAREEFKQVVTAAGWQFHFEGGRMP